MVCKGCGRELEVEMITAGICFNCGTKVESEMEEQILEQERIKQDLENKRKHLEQEKIKQEIELKQKIKDLSKSFLMTTGNDFSGYDIVEYKKVISAETVLGTGFFSEFSASISDMFGVENDRFATKLDSARESATEKLIIKAIKLGANAILAIDYDYTQFASNIIGVIANGTAVTAIKKEKY